MSNNVILTVDQLAKLLQVDELESNMDIGCLTEGNVIRGYFLDSTTHPYLLVNSNETPENGRRPVLTLSRRIGVTHNNRGHDLAAIETICIEYNQSAPKVDIRAGAIMGADYQLQHITNYNGDKQAFDQLSQQLLIAGLWNVPH